MAIDRNTAIRSSQILKHTLQLDDISPDALVWQEPVEDKDLTTPPGSPSEGDRYIVNSGGTFDWDKMNEDCSDISDWVDVDSNNGESTQTTFDTKSCFKFDTNTATAGNKASRKSSKVSFDSDYNVEINLYCDAIGTDEDCFWMLIDNGQGYTLNVKFRSDGLFLNDGFSFVEVGTDLVQQDVWQKWRFEVNNTNETCDIYLDDVLKASNVSCSSGSVDDNTLTLLGYNQNDRIVYVDYLKIGTQQGNNIAQYNGSSWDIYIPVEGWKTWIKDENKTYKYVNSSWSEDTLNVDDFTIKNVSNTLKIADRIELNIMLNAFRIAINGSLSQFGMIDGIADEFEDESGIDTVNSTNESYDSGNDLYQPTSTSALELDYMEYATDGAAQAAYVSSDGTDSYTKLLLHCNGLDGSTTFTDDSPSSHTVTAQGDAQIDTAQSVFGGASCLFDGNGDYLSIPDSDDWDFGSGDFTIDFRIRFNNFSDDIWYKIVEQYTDSNNHWYVGIYKNAAESYPQVVLHSKVGGSVNFNIWKMMSSFSTATWYHFAVTRDGNNFRIFQNGTQIAGTFTDSDSMPSLSASLRIGYDSSVSGANVDGWIDEFRISKGIAHWTSNFTPPSNEYVAIGNLQCYSEASIKNQGSYSLKAIAQQTDSLNDTLTKSGLSIDLSGRDTLKFDCYAGRTGTNLQMKIHDSGGTTSTKNIVISSANSWETTTWDISGIADANKDDIDSIIIEVTNADAINTFYVDNFYALGQTNNMTLISNSETAEAQPDIARIVLFEEDVDAITENTDLKAYVTRDGGTTYSQVTLADEGDYETGKRILTGTVDISGQPAGTSMEYKLTSLNNKDLKLHGVGLHWD